MNIIKLRPIPTLIVAAVSCLGSSTTRPRGSPQAVTSHVAAAGRREFPAHLVARSISVSSPEDTGPIEIYVERWSTDEELDELLGTVDEDGSAGLRAVLDRQRVRAGVVLMPGVQGHGE